jgi:hypothetical protein
MNLVDGRKFRTRKQSGDGEAAVASDGLGVVVAAKADVEPGALADGDAAAAAEESVRELAQTDRPDDVDGQRIFRMMTSSSAWLPTMKS